MSRPADRPARLPTDVGVVPHHTREQMALQVVALIRAMYSSSPHIHQTLNDIRSSILRPELPAVNPPLEPRRATHVKLTRAQVRDAYHRSKNKLLEWMGGDRPDVALTTPPATEKKTDKDADTARFMAEIVEPQQNDTKESEAKRTEGWITPRHALHSTRSRVQYYLDRPTYHAWTRKVEHRIKTNLVPPEVARFLPVSYQLQDFQWTYPDATVFLLGGEGSILDTYEWTRPIHWESASWLAMVVHAKKQTNPRHVTILQLIQLPLPLVQAIFATVSGIDEVNRLYVQSGHQFDAVYQALHDDWANANVSTRRFTFMRHVSDRLLRHEAVKDDTGDIMAIVNNMRTPVLPRQWSIHPAYSHFWSLHERGGYRVTCHDAVARSDMLVNHMELPRAAAVDAKGVWIVRLLWGDQSTTLAGSFGRVSIVLPLTRMQFRELPWQPFMKDQTVHDFLTRSRPRPITIELDKATDPIERQAWFQLMTKLMTSFPRMAIKRMDTGGGKPRLRLSPVEDMFAICEEERLLEPTSELSSARQKGGGLFFDYFTPIFRAEWDPTIQRDTLYSQGLHMDVESWAQFMNSHSTLDDIRVTLFMVVGCHLLEGLDYAWRAYRLVHTDVKAINAAMSLLTDRVVVKWVDLDCTSRQGRYQQACHTYEDPVHRANPLDNYVTVQWYEGDLFRFAFMMLGMFDKYHVSHDTAFLHPSFRGQPGGPGRLVRFRLGVQHFVEQRRRESRDTTRPLYDREARALLADAVGMIMMRNADRPAEVVRILEQFNLFRATHATALDAMYATQFQTFLKSRRVIHAKIECSRMEPLLPPLNVF